MGHENLTHENTRGIAIVRLNRPDKRNALSMDLIQEMIEVLESIRQDEEVRVVLLGSEGPVFSSGHDMSEMIGGRASFYEALFEACSRMMELIHDLPQPVIAQVQGVATAAGCQLVAACDLAIASEDARFGTPGVKIGLFCSTPMVPLSRAVGRKKALEMLLTGDTISAQEAERYGLINRVVPPEKLDEEAEAWVLRIAEASPLVLRIGKKAFYEQIGMEESRAYAYATKVIALNALAHDAHEGMAAFLEKRRPIWRGR